MSFIFISIIRVEVIADRSLLEKNDAEPSAPAPNKDLDDADDVDKDNEDSTESTTKDPYLASDYDDWYQPIINAIDTEPTKGSPTLPAVTPAADEGDGSEMTGEPE